MIRLDGTVEEQAATAVALLEEWGAESGPRRSTSYVDGDGPGQSGRPV